MFFIFRAAAVQDTHLKGVGPHNLGKVVFPSEEVLAIVPGREYPHGTGGVTEPALWYGNAALMQLAAERKYGWNRCPDGVIQRRSIAGTANGDAVSRPGKLEVIHRGAAQGSGHLGHRHIARLVPPVAQLRGFSVAPKTVLHARVQRVFPGILGVVDHQRRVLGDVPIAAYAFFAPGDRDLHCLVPGELGARIRDVSRGQLG